MEKTESRRRDLSNAVEELMLVCDTSEKELNKLVGVEQVSRSPGPLTQEPWCYNKLYLTCGAAQDTMVENNILKVEVKRVRDLLFSQLDSMFSLEKRKLDLLRTIKEREDDVRVFTKMLSQQLKASEEERQRLRFRVLSASRQSVAAFGLLGLCA